MEIRTLQRPNPAAYLLFLGLFCAILFFILGFPLSAQVSSGNPGDLDPTFGTGGIVTTPIGDSNETAYDLAMQPDGKLVVAGISYNYIFVTLNSVFALARYNTNGSLDTTFNPTGTTPGVVTTAIGTSDDTAHALVIQPDGKLVAAGYTNVGTAEEFALVRYNTDGSLDSTFGTDGIVTTAIGASSAAFDLAIQPDGKLVAAGLSLQGSSHEFAVVRYNTDGSLDTTFGAGGIVTTLIGIDDFARAIAIQSDGKIVVAGETSNGSDRDFALARYNTDGSLDTTFNPMGSMPGAVATGIGFSNDAAFALAIQSNGKLVAAGHTGPQYQFAVIRYNTDGNLDSTFGTAGIVTTVIGAHDEARAMAIQPNGKIVAAGFSYAGLFNMALVRYNTDGSLDTTFGTGGIRIPAIESDADFVRAVIVQPNGMLVAAGEAEENGIDYDFALVRYLGDPTVPGPDPSADSLTPVNISTLPSVAQGFTAVYSDSNGWQNISDASLSLSGNMHSEAIHYSPATNKFTLLGASGDCSPGNGATLTNGFLNLNCGASNISGSGNTLTITFNLTTQPPLSGAAYRLILAVVDQAGANSNKDMGYWVVNRRPSADSVTPMNSTTPVGTQQTFVSVYSDPDGYQNIAAANFYLSGNGGLNNEWLHYLSAPNLFTMMGTNDICSPGQATTLSNGFLTLDCGASSVSGSGTVLTITFRVTPEASASMINYTIFTAASDQAAAAYAIFAGTWGIQ